MVVPLLPQGPLGERQGTRHGGAAGSRRIGPSPGSVLGYDPRSFDRPRKQGGWESEEWDA